MAHEIYLKKAIELTIDETFQDRPPCGPSPSPGRAVVICRRPYAHTINPDSAEVVRQSTAQVFSCDFITAPVGMFGAPGQPGDSLPRTVVAKIFDPFFYKAPSAVRATSDYSHEVKAYRMLQSLLGKNVPSFYGAWNASVFNRDTKTVRTVQVLLLEDIQGETVGHIVRGKLVFSSNSPLQSYIISLRREAVRLHIMEMAVATMARLQCAGVIQGGELSIDKLMVRRMDNKSKRGGVEDLRVVALGFSKASIRNRPPLASVHGAVQQRIELFRLRMMKQFAPWFPATWTSSDPVANETAFLEWVISFSPRYEETDTQGREADMKETAQEKVDKPAQEKADKPAQEQPDSHAEGMFDDAVLVEKEEEDPYVVVDPSDCSEGLGEGWEAI